MPNDDDEQPRVQIVPGMIRPASPEPYPTGSWAAAQERVRLQRQIIRLEEALVARGEVARRSEVRAEALERELETAQQRIVALGGWVEELKVALGACSAAIKALMGSGSKPEQRAGIVRDAIDSYRKADDLLE